MEWIHIGITTSAECADIVSMILMDFGSEGVCIHDSRDIAEVIKSKTSWDYVDESLIDAAKADEKVHVSGCFPTGFEIKELLSELDALKGRAGESAGSLEVIVGSVNDADWENEWRKYYDPIELENVAIVPKWLSYDGKCETKVLMDPGMAFGTGKHETTSMCITLMQHIDVKGKDVLDMGCGSGILGITALKLGAKHSIMSDIEPIAVTAATENAALNDVGARAEFYCGDLTEKVCGSFDVVLANLTADILLRFKKKLPELVKKGGHVIISGLIHARADEVLDEYEKSFELVERKSEGEWQAMLLKAR